VTVVWQGVDAPRMEIARVVVEGAEFSASGTQIGAGYEMRYELAGDTLRVSVSNGPANTYSLSGADFFDLGYSPLFNSLPVIRDRLLDGGGARDYRMRWVSVPDLDVEESAQRYEPLDGRRIRFTAGDFQAELEFDGLGLVERYEGLAQRVYP
jgi:hypothetical protein